MIIQGLNENINRDSPFMLVNSYVHVLYPWIRRYGVTGILLVGIYFHMIVDLLLH